jgi:Zinc-binding dehydrogenase
MSLPSLAARGWGTDVVVNHATADVATAVKEATWKTSLGAVRPGGRVVVCGATTGPNPPAQLQRWWWKQLTLYGSTMGTREDFLGTYELVRSGRARVHVDRVFPLSGIPAAHERLEAGEQLGKSCCRSRLAIAPFRWLRLALSVPGKCVGRAEALSEDAAQIEHEPQSEPRMGEPEPLERHLRQDERLSLLERDDVGRSR